MGIGTGNGRGGVRSGAGAKIATTVVRRDPTKIAGNKVKAQEQAERRAEEQAIRSQMAAATRDRNLTEAIDEVVTRMRAIVTGKSDQMAIQASGVLVKLTTSIVAEQRKLLRDAQEREQAEAERHSDEAAEQARTDLMAKLDALESAGQGDIIDAQIVDSDVA